MVSPARHRATDPNQLSLDIFSADTAATEQQRDTTSSGVPATPLSAAGHGLSSTPTVTATSSAALEVGGQGTAPTPEVIYPHIFDPDAGTTSQAMRLIGQAVNHAQSAVEAYGAGELSEVSSALGLVAAAAASAHASTTFNESLGAVVSYVRRAALTAHVADVSLPQLMALVKALRALREQPMISLEAAAGLIDELEQVGWSGMESDVAAFVKALFEAIEGPSSRGVSIANDTQVLPRERF